MSINYDLGAVSSYGLAVQNGFTGTVQEWVQAITNASQTYDDLRSQIRELGLQIPPLDSTLTRNDSAANAYTVGEWVNRLESLISTPLTASVISQMTDRTKVYVYTGSETGYTAGNWYYHNGSAWVSGGVYNAEAITTDTSLTIAGSAADAKKVGGELNHVKWSINDIHDGVKIVKNLVTEVIGGQYPDYNSSGVHISTASNRAYAKVFVEGGKTYSINLQHSGNFSFWAYEENGVEYGISKLSSYTTNYVATAPSNATILYLCNSGWTSSTGLVVMETDISILGANINDYPFNVVSKVESDKLIDLNNLADVVGITKYSKWERGSLNTSAGNPLPTKDTSSAFMLQRICTPISEPISLHLGDILSINGNRDITYIAFRYNSEGNAWAVTSWMTSDYTVPVDGNYWVIIRNTDNSGITYITDLSESFTISRKSGIINSKIKGISNDIPSYYFENNYLRDKLSVIKQKSDILNGIGFVFVTDLHWEVNQGQSKKLIEYIRENSTVDSVICGGDFARAYGDTVQLRSDYDSTLEFMNYIGKECFYGVRGNHDFHTKASAGASEFDGYTWAKTYNAIYRNSEQNVVNALPQHGAYCIDNEAQQTRFICLNSSDWNLTYDKVEEGVPYISVDQVRWFISQLLEKTGWRIVVISHIPSAESLSSNYSSQSIIQDILEAFATKTNFSTTYKSTSISGDFTSTTNKLICHISGHEHHDGYSSESGVLSIVTTCDALYQDDGYGGVAGTTTEHAFDVFFFDYDQGTIYAVRIGRGVNRSWNIPS